MTLGSEVIAKAKALADTEGMTLSMLCLSALRALLERYKGIDAGIGLPDSLRFIDVLRACGSTFEELPSAEVEECETGSLPLPAEYSLVLSKDAGGALQASFCSQGSVLDEAGLWRFSKHFENILAAAVADPYRCVWDIPLLTSEEYNELARWNQTATDYPRDAVVHELFEQQAAATPGSRAVIRGEESVTYQQLNERANQLAHYLAGRGVTQGSVVGIALDRSIAMVVAMLAVLKTGACYVPLDSSYPTDRLRFMVEDSGAKVLVTDRASRTAFDGVALCAIDIDQEQGSLARQSIQNLQQTSIANPLAYVMYTSGSTGTPKGVEVLHRGIVRLVKNTDYIHFDATETIAQISKFSFDAITFEVWGALLNGGRLVILPYETILSPARFAEALQKWNITSMFMTAALFNVMAKRKPDAFSGLRNVLVGGDVVSPESARIVLRSAPGRLVNAYGPTECTTFSCCWDIGQIEASGSIPIGRPIANSEAYLLDRHLQPVPVGVLGEIYLGGDGLARGYRNRQELTAQRFVPHVFKWHANERLYKTGDRGRYRADGSIEFAGRTDHQVKLRGHRIELGEIEAALRKHPDVADSVVIVAPHTHGEPRLAAYVDKRSHSNPSAEELKRFLTHSLPDFMVPTHVLVLDAFPLTPEGKIDRKALPPITSPEKAPAELPVTAIENEIASIWKSVLRRTSVGLDDNFFDLGGTSLLIGSVESELQARLKIAVAVTDLFRFPTIRSLAMSLSESPGSTNTRFTPARQRAAKQQQILQSLRKQAVAS